MDKKTKIIYAIIIGICIISVIVIIFMQFGKEKSVSTGGSLIENVEKDYEKLESEFVLLFDNAFPIDDENYSDIKEEISKTLVFTSYSVIEEKEDIFNLNVSIPYINIKSPTVNKYNDEIKQNYQKKAESILKTSNKNRVTYTVKYACDIQDDVLSIVIYDNLIIGDDTQKTGIKTYNYYLNSDKEVDLNYVLNLENVSKSNVQDRINKEIASKKEKDTELNENAIYERDLDSDIYKVDNIKQFFFHNGSIYIIFSYGNDDDITQMDLVII